MGLSDFLPTPRVFSLRPMRPVFARLLWEAVQDAVCCLCRRMSRLSPTFRLIYFSRLLCSLTVAGGRYAHPLFKGFRHSAWSVGSHLPTGVYYRALRRSPGQDFHLQEQCVLSGRSLPEAYHAWDRGGLVLESVQPVFSSTWRYTEACESPRRTHPFRSRRSYRRRAATSVRSSEKESPNQSCAAPTMAFPSSLTERPRLSRSRAARRSSPNSSPLGVDASVTPSE